MRTATVGFGIGKATVPVKPDVSGANYALAFPANGSIVYDITLNSNCVFTLSGGTAKQEQFVKLILRQDSTAGRVATLPANVKWPSGNAPALNSASGGVDVLTISTPDAGDTLIGSF